LTPGRGVPGHSSSIRLPCRQVAFFQAADPEGHAP
jgi:hypothetical protein